MHLDDFSFSGFLTPLLFISVEMALEQNIKGLQAQNAQLQEMFLNLSKGLEEVKALLTRDMIMGIPGDDRDNWLGPRIEVAILKDQLAS